MLVAALVRKTTYWQDNVYFKKTRKTA